MGEGVSFENCIFSIENQPIKNPITLDLKIDTLKETQSNNTIEYTYYNGHFTADCFRLSFIIRKESDIETEWTGTQKTRDWREDLQI